MQILLDTHILFWNLTLERKRLTTKVQKLIIEANELILPTIVLLELEGLLAKKQKRRYFDILLKEIPGSKYTIVPLDLEVIGETHRTAENLELHDKVIVATAKLLDLPIITKDEQITKVYKKTIW